MLFLRYGTLILAVLLILVYWQWAIHSEFPHVKIGDISKSMNYARITVEGTISSNPNVYLTDYGTYSSVSFYVDDGTGQVKVVAYDTIARNMAKNGIIPAYGMHVTIRGATVMWRGGDLKLAISAAEQIILSHDKPESMNWQDIRDDNTNLHEGLWITLHGNLTSDLDDKGSFYRTYLGNEDQSVVIYIPKGVLYLGGNKISGGNYSMADLVTGSELEITGVLKWYNGWEIIVDSPKDITMVKKG